MLCLPVILTHQ